MLITGAGGFVCSHLAQGFLAMGDAVTGLDLSFDAATRERLAGANLVEQALTAQSLASLGSFDLVIHGAALTTVPLNLDSTGYVELNVGLLRDCLHFAIASGASDFVFLSSSGVFSPEDGDGVHLETTIPTATAPYAIAKRMGEEAAVAASSATLRAVGVRLGPVYGPAETSRGSRVVVSQIRRWLDAAVSGNPITIEKPNEIRDWTFAPDLPFALDALLGIRPKLTGIVHLTAASRVSNRDLAAAIADITGGACVEQQVDSNAARLPMASSRLDLDELFAWTPLAAGLTRTFSEEVLR